MSALSGRALKFMYVLVAVVAVLSVVVVLLSWKKISDIKGGGYDDYASAEISDVYSVLKTLLVPFSLLAVLTNALGLTRGSKLRGASILGMVLSVLMLFWSVLISSAVSLEEIGIFGVLGLFVLAGSAVGAASILSPDT